MAEQEVELSRVLERRETAEREWRSLSSRSKKDEQEALERVRALNKLADDVAEQEARGREEEQRARVAEIETMLAEAETSVRELGERLTGERNKLSVLERETLMARRYDPASAARVETMERQQAEEVQWFAVQKPSRPEEWPVEIAGQIAARVEEMRAESEAGRARRRKEAAKSLLPSGGSRGR